MDPIIGRSIAGYRVVDLIGRGGMGAVYRACDEQQREIALKLLPLDQLEEPRAAERFQREAELAAAFDHANIVKVYAAGRADGFLYMAMELIAGESLRQLLQREVKLPLERSLEIIAQVLVALQTAHNRKIIHRDIKAENVLLTEEGTVKLLDFGVAKVESGALLTRTDEILGTVEYMAPEQILGDVVGPAADLYSAGVLLYEMLVGVLPFSGDSPATLVYRQLNEEARPPSALNPSVPRPLDRLVVKLLEKLPEERYETAAAVLVDLEAIRQRVQMMGGVGEGEKREEGEEGEELRSRDFRPRFVGRQRELEQFQDRFAVLHKGGGAFFVRGEAGIGKTRLVEEMVRHVYKQKGLVIRGICYYEHGLGPYMPLLEALSNLFRQGEGGLEEAERGALSELLAQVSPELAPLAEHGETSVRVRAGFAATFGAEGEPEAARQRFFDGVFELLAKAASFRPLVLVLEDMHWADESSLLLLQYLAKRGSEVPLLCVATYRPEELIGEGDEMHALVRVERELEMADVVVRMELERLGRKEILQLASSLFMEAAFGDDFGDFLSVQSEGNPFIAVELLKLLRNRGILCCEGGVWSIREEEMQQMVPDRVNALVLRRVDQLDGRLRELLQIAAVIGPGFTSKLLEPASGMSRIELLKGLFKLEKTYLLIEGQDGRYDFSHSKIREVLYQEIPWELRCEYHRIVAAILEQQEESGQPVEPLVLGQHLYEAEEYERSLPYLRRGGDMVLQLCDWRQATVLFERLEDACRRSAGEEEILLHALESGGMANGHLGRGERALELFTEMQLEAQRAEMRYEEASAWISMGKEHTRSRHFDEAERTFTKALEVAPDDTPLLLGRALNAWGVVDFECGRYDQAEARWEKGLEKLQDRTSGEAGDVINNLAVLATMRGDFERAWELYEQVLELDATGVPTPLTVLTLCNMGMLRADQEEWEQALELYERSLKVVHLTRYFIYQPTIELNQAEALIGKGNLVEARAACSRALCGYRRQEDVLGVADSLRFYGRICRLEREWEEGQACLDKSIELNRQIGESVSLGEALFELGLLWRDRGQAEGAIEALHQAKEIFEQAQAALDLDRVCTVLEELEAA